MKVERANSGGRRAFRLITETKEEREILQWVLGCAPCNSQMLLEMTSGLGDGERQLEIGFARVR